MNCEARGARPVVANLVAAAWNFEVAAQPKLEGCNFLQDYHNPQNAFRVRIAHGYRLMKPSRMSVSTSQVFC